MFFPEGQIRVHLYGQPVDMRKSFTGLYALTREGLRLDPVSGELFVFVSRRATMMKVLYFDRSGFGTFVWPRAPNGTVALSYAQLSMLLEGIDWRRTKKAWRPQPPIPPNSDTRK